MSKKLEEYIREHKKAFEVGTPSDQLWSKIETELDRKKVKKPLRVPLWFSIAASLIVVMGVTFIYTYPERERGIDLADVNPVYAHKEMKFASLIELKKDSLMIYAQENPKLYSEFSADLQKLGADYENLKKQLQNSSNQKLVVRAMVKNLELQLQVVSQQLSIINEVSQYKRENNI